MIFACSPRFWPRCMSELCGAGAEFYYSPTADTHFYQRTNTHNEPFPFPQFLVKYRYEIVCRPFSPIRIVDLAYINSFKRLLTNCMNVCQLRSNKLFSIGWKQINGLLKTASGVWRFVFFFTLLSSNIHVLENRQRLSSARTNIRCGLGYGWKPFATSISDGILVEI